MFYSTAYTRSYCKTKSASIKKQSVNFKELLSFLEHLFGQAGEEALQYEYTDDHADSEPTIQMSCCRSDKLGIKA